MTLIKKSDVSEANSSSSRNMSNLSKDKEDAEALINAIQDFIETSKTNLEGNSFDAVRNHLQGYINVLQTRIKIADSLIQSLSKANTTMIDYMEDESTLNTDDIEVTRTWLNDAKSEAAIWSNKIYNYSDDDEYSKGYYQGRLNVADANITKYTKKLRLLENLESTDSSAYSSLLGSEAEMRSFETVVGGITTIR